MDKLAAPLLAMLPTPACALEDALFSCPELPDWAPPQKNCPKSPLVSPVNDHYEFWQGISW